MAYLSESAPIFFQRFYTGWITNRNQLTTPIRLLGRRVIELYDALLAGNDLEITPRLTLMRRPGYVSYAPAVTSAPLLNMYTWKSATNGIFQVFDTTVDIEYIAPGDGVPTILFTKPAGAVGNKSFFFGVGNYLFVSGIGFSFKWDGPNGQQGVTNWGIAIGSANNSIGPTAVGTGADVARAGGTAWSTPGNITAPDAAYATCNVPIGGTSDYLKGTNFSFSIPATNQVTGILVEVKGLQNGIVQYRPSAYKKGIVSSGDNAYTNPSLAFDKNFSTASQGRAQSGDAAVTAEETWFSFPAGPAGPTSVTLKVTSAFTAATTGQAILRYSKDNGGTWTTIYSATTTRATTTDSVSLPLGQDLTKVQVDAYVNATSGTPQQNTHSIFEIWVEVNGPAAGSPLNVAMLKNGFVAGVAKNANLPATNGFVSFGGAADLWGTTWVPNDINSVNFGVYLYANSAAGGTYNVDFIRITIYGTGGPTVAVSGAGGAFSAVNGFTYVYAYGNSVSGEISNSTSPSVNTGPFTSKAGVNVTLTASGDPQVNQIHVYRTTDSGGGSIFFELPTSPYANANAVISDTSADTSLQPNSIAATNFQNTPPPVNLVAMEWFAGRLWGVVGNLLYASTGADSVSGLQQSNWNPVYVYPLPTPISRLVGTPNGMLVHCNDDCHIVRGTATVNFTVNHFERDLAVRNYNAVDTDGSNIYLFTSDRQLLQVGGSGTNDIGQVIADQLLNVDPTQAYVTVYRFALDTMLFLLDSVSGILYPYNLNQQCWCLPAVLQFGTPATACGAMEVSAGTWKYIIGAGTALAQRDLNTFTDLGNPYSPNTVIGTIQLADPLSLAKVENSILQLTNAGNIPTVSVLPDEAGCTLTNLIGNQITGKFTAIPNPVIEPPTYGAQPVNFRSLQYQWLTTALPEALQLVQTLIQWGNENAQNELIGFGISGKQQGDSPQTGTLPQLQGH